MTRKSKLVLKVGVHADIFKIVKTVNTLQYGVPGDSLNRAKVDHILKSEAVRRLELTVEILEK